MSSGFISEAELAEQRKAKQDEWERVRSAEEPIERPEEKYDPRPLYDKLQEQKTKRDLEYEEAHKLKNMIKGLDDDEVEFLDLVDRKKLEEERKKNEEEAQELRDFKARVASLQDKMQEERLKSELKTPQTGSKISGSKHSQVKLLAGVVVKKPEKSPGQSGQGTKRKLSESADDEKSLKKSPDGKELEGSKNKPESEAAKSQSQYPANGMKCIGILPGLGSYNDSSDSDCSSDSDSEYGNPVNTKSRSRPQ
ncbi:PSME3-interacting protein isoform X2 [Microplitis mediator]|uniref:PSME3-interacting protein isoform X2 n=1 Tax=Microplitis mediator TaxID=375433 RepID=UPI002557453F|nr:PSME3-interacting protein isoform X2 [Microplitis mediator]